MNLYFILILDGFTVRKKTYTNKWDETNTNLSTVIEGYDMAKEAIFTVANIYVFMSRIYMSSSLQRVVLRSPLFRFFYLDFFVELMKF